MIEKRQQDTLDRLIESLTDDERAALCRLLFRRGYGPSLTRVPGLRDIEERVLDLGERCWMREWHFHQEYETVSFLNPYTGDIEEVSKPVRPTTYIGHAKIVIKA